LQRHSHTGEGADVTEFMGFEKWEAPIPVHMAGDVYNIGTENTLAFDIENIKNFPDVLKEGEEVIITEKLHGTFVCFGFKDGEWFVTSKGMGARGLALTNNEANANNLYVRTFNHLRAPLEGLRGRPYGTVCR
jgi:RNA ligase (TIGR02306 family)